MYLRATELIGLRHPRASDGPRYIELRRASDALLTPWEPSAPKDVADPIAVGFSRMLENADTAQFQKHLICRISDDGIVGYVALNEIVRGAFQSAYLGYWIGAPYVLHGYATAAIRQCVDRAFTELGLHRVEANIIPRNAPSLATARKCGFRREGYSPRYLQIAGEWQDHERWALTREDWTPLP